MSATQEEDKKPGGGDGGAHINLKVKGQVTSFFSFLSVCFVLRSRLGCDLGFCFPIRLLCYQRLVLVGFAIFFLFVCWSWIRIMRPELLVLLHVCFSSLIVYHISEPVMFKLFF